MTGLLGVVNRDKPEMMSLGITKFATLLEEVFVNICRFINTFKIHKILSSNPFSRAVRCLNIGNPGSTDVTS